MSSFVYMLFMRTKGNIPWWTILSTASVNLCDNLSRKCLMSRSPALTNKTRSHLSPMHKWVACCWCIFKSNDSPAPISIAYYHRRAYRCNFQLIYYRFLLTAHSWLLNLNMNTKIKSNTFQIDGVVRDFSTWIVNTFPSIYLML